MRKVRENNVNFMLIKKKAEEKRYQEEQLRLKLEEEKHKLVLEAEKKEALLLEQEKEKQRLIFEKESRNFLFLGTYVHGERKIDSGSNNRDSGTIGSESKVSGPNLVGKCFMLDRIEIVEQNVEYCEAIAQEGYEEQVQDNDIYDDCDGFIDNINDLEDSFLVRQGDDCLFRGNLEISSPVRLLNREMGYFNLTGCLPGGSGLQQKSESNNKSNRKQIQRKKCKDSLYFLDLSLYTYRPGLHVGSSNNELRKEEQSIGFQNVSDLNEGQGRRRKKRGGRRRKGLMCLKEGDQVVSMSKDYKRLGWLRSGNRESYNRITIRHFDCSLEVIGSGDYVRNVYGINPGLKELFPSLFNMAKQYDAYLFKNLFFEFQPLNTQEDGIVGLAYLDYDDKRTIDVVDDMETIYGFVKGNYVKRVSYQVGRYYLDIDVWSKLFRRYVRIKSLEGIDDRDLFDTGRLFLSTEGFAGNYIVGKLRIDYDVEFFGLRVKGDEGPRYDCEIEPPEDLNDSVLIDEGKDKSFISCCAVCLVNQKDVLFLPCKHIVVCSVCSPGLVDCPVCRSQIINRVTGIFVT